MLTPTTTKLLQILLLLNLLLYRSSGSPLTILPVKEATDEVQESGRHQLLVRV